GAAAVPIGSITWRVVGGASGGVVPAAIAGEVASNLTEGDRQMMLKVISRQSEFQAMAFMLTKDEIDNLSLNLDQVITQKSLEDLYASSNKRATANSLVKPHVVRVVKQRPIMSFSVEEAIKACEEVA